MSETITVLQKSADSATAPLSKSARKRLAKKYKEQQAKSSQSSNDDGHDVFIPGLQPLPEHSIKENIPLDNANDPHQQPIEDRPATFKDYLEKKIWKLEKKQARIQKYEAMVNDSEQKEQVDGGEAHSSPLNEAQKQFLSKKNDIVYPLPTLKEAYEAYTQYLEEDQQERDRAAKELQEKHQKELERVKQEALEQGKQNLHTVLKFLRAAAIKRQLAADALSGNANLKLVPVEETLAFELLLQRLYVADNVALETTEKLIDGVDEPLDSESPTASYKELRHFTLMSPEDLYKSSLKINEEANTNDSVSHGPDSDVQLSFFLKEEPDDGTEIESTQQASFFQTAVSSPEKGNPSTLQASDSEGKKRKPLKKQKKKKKSNQPKSSSSDSNNDSHTASPQQQ